MSGGLLPLLIGIDDMATILKSGTHRLVIGDIEGAHQILTPDLLERLETAAQEARRLGRAAP